IIANGNLYCPATPTTLPQLGPLPRDATAEQVTAHDTRAAELSRHKPGRISADDADGYPRVMSPAAMGKIRCPLRPQSMTLDRARPEILAPPEQPPACCAQQTHHRPPGHCGQDPPETRLPPPRAPPPLPPPHRLRAHLRNPQGPSHQQHRPRLVPAHGPDPAHPLADLPARRPQPAHPHRLGDPAGPPPKPPDPPRHAPPTPHRHPAITAAASAPRPALAPAASSPAPPRRSR